MMLSLFASTTRRSPRTASQWSESSAATSVSGSTATCCDAIPAVGSGAVGSGVSVSDLWGHAATAIELTTHHAPRTKLLICNELVTARNIVCAPGIFKKRASARHPPRSPVP